MQASQSSRGISGSVAVGNLRMISSEQVSPVRQFLLPLLAVMNTVTGKHSINK